jgi:hypothetical protein
MTRRIAAAGLLAVLAGLAGCGGKKVSISGTITQGGEKLTWPDGGHLLVLFLPENPDRNQNRYRAETDIETSTYKIDAIPPGRYTVAIQYFDMGFNDKFGKAYDPGRTTLPAEVTHDGQVIDVDVPATGNGGGGGFGGGKGGFGGKKGGKRGGPPPEPPPGPPGAGEPGKAEPAPPPGEKKDEPAKPGEKKD